MNGLEFPVIPNLQNISENNEYHYQNCLYTQKKGAVVVTKYGKRMTRMRFLYHTCVIIKYDTNKMNTTMENKTIWNSHNNDNLGTLLIAYFKYYATRENLISGISILRAGERGAYIFNAPVSIQDPFLSINNIS